jgi:predicted dehydrogenase
MNQHVLIVGTGAMALEYAKVLTALTVPFETIGRGEANCKKFEEAYPTVKVHRGGLQANLDKLSRFTHGIIATNVVSLAQNLSEALTAGLRAILIEKPGFLTPAEATELAKQHTTEQVYVAYNRRFLASTLQAKKYIEEDGGVLSFNFEFTEWGHVIEKLECPIEEKNFLFLANSTHVVDLAFYLGGKPLELTAYKAGATDRHPAGAVYTGSGRTEKNALFSYQANWISAGRWAVEVLTSKRRFIFKPLEKLQIQNKGSVAIAFDETVDYSLDEQFKPGLYLQTQHFLKGSSTELCSFEEQLFSLKTYSKIAGY